MLRFGVIAVVMALAGCSGSALKCTTDAVTGDHLCVGPGVTEVEVATAMSGDVNAVAPAQGTVQQLQAVGGLPHTVETKYVNPTTMIQTHTYGTLPPAAAEAKPVASRAKRECTYNLVGGTSYVCLPH